MELLTFIESLDTRDWLLTLVVLFYFMDKLGLLDRVSSAIKKLYEDRRKDVRAQKRREEAQKNSSGIETVELLEFEADVQDKVAQRSQEFYREERLYKIIEGWMQRDSMKIMRQLEIIANRSQDHTSAIAELSTSLVQMDRVLSQKVHYLGDSIRELAGVIAERIPTNEDH